MHLLEDMAKHIEILNREMGSVKTSIDWIKFILAGNLTLMLATMGFAWRAKFWAKKNGSREVSKDGSR